MNSHSDPAKELFLKAIENYHPHEWDAFLEGSCLDNPDLLQRVGALLASHEADDEIFDRYSATERPGTEMGPYKLLQQIGEGGFAVVYMAQQLRPISRKVALKVIKPGMDTKEVIARFEAERQALAVMDHPNIAQIFYAGVTEKGRPYFVMELVQGVPITQFCDENRLTPEQRIDIFTDVCNAIQHAHERNIIHRDIKPSNVMITLHDGKPVPKVIDFGVAKALGHTLTDRTVFTAYGQMIGTPQYMSPEQAEMSGLDLDMRSDVYSLGVLLYELLTGTTPLRKEQIQETALANLQRLICTDEPAKPSVRITKLGKRSAQIAENRAMRSTKLGCRLTGDLDVITMKTIEKDRHRRYSSAADLTKDLLLHLNNRPISARPPTIAYRISKMARRHRKQAWPVVVSFCSALLLIAVVSGLFAISDARKAQEMNRRAEEAVKVISEASE